MGNSQALNSCSNDHLNRMYPLGEFFHFDLPNDYDPTKVKLPSGNDFGCCISRASLGHKTWYIYKTDYRDFMSIIDSGVANNKDDF